MGDISDYYRDSELEYSINHIQDDEGFEEPVIDYTVWTTRDGKKLLIKNMGDAHLLNTINMINRNASSEEWFDALALELKRRKLSVPKKSPYFGCDATEIDIH